MTARRGPYRTAAIAAALLSLVALPAAAATLAPRDIRQDLFSTCFINAQEGWVVGERGRVFHTADGGATFTQMRTGTSRAFLAIACFPDKRLIAVGQRGIGFRSRDGGKHWEPLKTGSEHNLLSVDFASESTGVAVGDYGTIVRTEDGGSTWTKVSLPAEVPLPEDIAEVIEPGDILLYDVDFVTPERGWIVGEFGTIFATSDAGHTWVAHKSPVETTLFGVDFADENNGWAVGLESVLLHTTDGGSTWTSQTMRSNSGFVLSLYDIAVQGRSGWAVGNSGFVLHSSDGGNTWRQVTLPIELAGKWLRGVTLTPDKRGFLIGAQGLLLTVQEDRLRRVGP